MTDDPIEQAFAYLDIGHPTVKAALAEIARLRAIESRVLAESDKQEAIGFVNVRALTQLANGQWAIINPKPEGDATHPVFAKEINK